MAIAQPAFVVAQVGQDVTVTTTIAADTTAWTATHELRTAIGGTLIASKTVGSGITNNAGSTSTMVTTFDAADLTTLTPGAYVHRLERTNSGSVYAIFDWSTFLLTEDEAAPQLTNLSDYIAFAGDSETVSDADAKYLLLTIGAAETSVRDFCGRQFNYAQYTEYPIATWTDKIELLETPVVTTNMDIRFDFSRTFGTDTALTAGTDYLIDVDKSDGKSWTGHVRKINSVWQGYVQRPPGLLSSQRIYRRGPIKAVYNGGFTLIPFDLKQAIFQIVQQRTAARGRGRSLASESGMNYSYSQGPLEEELMSIGSVWQTLTKYRRGGMLIG